MKSQFRMLFAIFVLLIAVGCLCNGSNLAPSLPSVNSPAATNAPASTSEAAGTTATSAPASTGQEFFTENFDSDISSNWSQTVELNGESNGGNKSEAKITVDNGYLAFDFGKNLIGYEFYQPHTYKNVRIDARVDNRGTNVNDILLVCRSSDEGHYLVDVANSGLFSMYAYDGTKKSYTQIYNGGSTKIKSGKEINDYALVCNDKTLTLYINDFEVRSYTDNQFIFREGQVGIGVASESQIPVKVNFDWVKISQP